MAVILRATYADYFGKTNSCSFNLEAINGAPYSFMKLTKDEVSVAFGCLHNFDTIDREMPLGTKTFEEENFLFWSQCAKAQLVKMRVATSRFTGVDTSHKNGKDFSDKYKAELKKAKINFRLAMSYRRNKRFLNTAIDKGLESWKRKTFTFCRFLLIIQKRRCDNNFVGQMIDRLVHNTYEFIADSISGIEKDLDEMQEVRKVKTVAAFVLECDDSWNAFGFRFNILHKLNTSESKHAADKLGIRPIFNNLLAELEP